MASATDTRPPVEHIGKPMLGSQRLPFSNAVRVGDTLYFRARSASAPTASCPRNDAQARQTMDNIGAVLKGQGLGWGDVVKCTVMLDNMADWPAFNKVYVTYFTDGSSRPEALSARTGWPWCIAGSRVHGLCGDCDPPLFLAGCADAGTYPDMWQFCPAG